MEKETVKKWTKRTGVLLLVAGVLLLAYWLYMVLPELQQKTTLTPLPSSIGVMQTGEMYPAGQNTI